MNKHTLPKPDINYSETLPLVGDEEIVKQEETTEITEKKSIFDKLAYPTVGLLLLSFCLVVLVWTLPDMGLTDDDDFYVPAGIDYIRWTERAVKGIFDGDFSEFSKDRIGRGFWNNHEHPAFAKLVIGLNWLIWYDKLKLMGQMDAGRMGVICLAMLLFYLVFRFGWEVFSPRAGVFAVLALLFMPRPFYHMHVGTLDIPTASTYFLVVYAIWRAEKSRTWIILAGIFYGVAMCTKLNGPFVVFPLLVYWFYRWRQAYKLGEKSTLSFNRMFYTGISMTLLSFPAFLALWPWLYHDTVARLIEYFKFHFYHYGIRLLYLGDIYEDPFAPWHAPVLYAVFTIPVVTLLLGMVGLYFGVKQLSPRNLKSFPDGAGHKNDYALLCAANFVFCVALVAISHTPKYGGVKLFQPAFPFFALLAGYGFDILLDRMSEISKFFKKNKNLLAPITGVVLLMPAIIGMIRVYPYMLTYYNELAGGPVGGLEIGMERQYYDVCYRTTIDYWTNYGPKYSKVSYEPNLGEYRRTYPWYKRDKILRPDVRTVDQRVADFMILTHERRWGHYQELLQEYRKRPIVHTEKIWGVPLYTIYDLRDEKRRKEAPVKLQPDELRLFNEKKKTPPKPAPPKPAIKKAPPKSPAIHNKNKVPQKKYEPPKAQDVKKLEFKKQAK